VFRFETFGDEHVWTEPLHLNDVVEKNVDPTTALKVGLKVDKSPATTVALLKMNAIVGLQATVDADDHITRLGVTCALCHSNVDNSVTPGIGRRKDGWPTGRTRPSSSRRRTVWPKSRTKPTQVRVRSPTGMRMSP